LSGRKLGVLVDTLNDDRRTAEISQDLSEAEKQYEDLLKAFEEFKQNQQDQQNDIESKLRQDESNMDKLKETRDKLQAELDQLKKIEEVLPAWCSNEE